MSTTTQTDLCTADNVYGHACALFVHVGEHECECKAKWDHEMEEMRV